MNRKPLTTIPMYDYKNFTIAVDFDDTCVRATKAGYCYPDTGPNIPYAVFCLRELSKHMRIILWTCREGEALEEAVAWFKRNGIKLFGINNNPDPYWVANPTHKVYADIYIDDNNVAIPFYYAERLPGESKPQYIKTVDWGKIYELVMIQFNAWTLKNKRKMQKLNNAARRAISKRIRGLEERE